MDIIRRHSTRLRKSGIFIALIGTMLFTVSHLFIRILSSELHPLQITAQAELLIPFLALFFLAYTKTSVKPEKSEIKYLVAYSLSLSSAVLCVNCSFFFISPFDSEAIIGTNVIFTVVLAAVFLKEVIDLLDVVTVIISCSGIVFVAQPSFLFHRHQTTSEKFRLYGSILAVCASISISLTMCINRRIVKTNTFVVLFYGYVLLVTLSFASAFAAGVIKVSKTPKTYVYLLLISLCDSSSQFMLIQALKLEDATPISLVGVLNQPLILILQMIFLNLIPNKFSFIGSAIICSAFLFYSFKEKFLDYFGLEVRGICIRKKDTRDLSDSSSSSSDYGTCAEEHVSLSTE
ncbi:Uncharacterised protein at_DN1493 [Pycnogonum litorale]